MNYDTVLVTGGAGFIGSHTVDALLEKGVKVWVLDNLSTGYTKNLRKWMNNPKFHFQKKSTTNYSAVDSIAKKVDAIVHLAAVVSPYLSVKKPEIVNEVNVIGTLNVLRASVKSRIQRLVFVSSSSVYGNQIMLPISEDNPLHPVTPYGASKLSGEKYCEAFHQTHGLSTISLRYFNVYGDRQSANPYSGVIAIFTNNITKGRRPIVYGDGEQTRDFIHVSDVVEANLQALLTTKGAGEAFNIGTGQATTINQLCSYLGEIYGRNVDPRHTNKRTGDIQHSYADTTRTKRILRIHPKIPLKKGLRLLAEHAGCN